MTADDVIEELGLEPHPEGGYFRELYREEGKVGSRGAVTTIYFLLKAGDISRWHRVDATEIWNFHTGAPLRLSIKEDGKEAEDLILGGDVLAGDRPQGIVPPHAWQQAESLGNWTLVGCQVAPAFQFEGFEMAPPEWSPG